MQKGVREKQKVKSNRVGVSHVGAQIHCARTRMADARVLLCVQNYGGQAM
jgi:hypothetical protein